MLDLQEFLWSFSLISLALYSVQGITKAIHMALTTLSSPSSSTLSSPLSRVHRLLVGKGGAPAESPKKVVDEHEAHDNPTDNNLSISSQTREIENVRQDYQFDKYIYEKPREIFDEKSKSLETMNGLGSIRKSKKRPQMLVIPQNCPALEFDQMNKKLENKEFEVEGKDFCLASKKGRRETMEDGYGAMVDILGDPKQAFFTVIDGHGGRSAADYVAQNLGNNILKALENFGDDQKEDPTELAIRGGYQVTDKDFLSQGVSSGACAASALLRHGELHVASVGDCRVVISKNGVAHALTTEHRPSREDERLRIQNSGGYVDCRNGVWRVQGSLAVSRAIGDLHLKEWVISEPEIHRLRLTSDCEFLIIASDGLWDKVNDQEAVDVVKRDETPLKVCKKLVDMSCSRGNMDDVTVMLINLHNFQFVKEEHNAKVVGSQ